MKIKNKLYLFPCILLSISSAAIATGATDTKLTVQRPTNDREHPFSNQLGYLQGDLAMLRRGYSSVTVDNSQNDSDVLVKLFSLDKNPPKAVSEFPIRANEKFTVENLKAGNYDVRYRDLKSKELFRTEKFNLKEIRTSRGVKFSRIRLTLYKVANGNMHTQPISENEF
jgi:hypothetical protein